MTVTEADFGKLQDGRVARIYTLRHRQGMVVKVTNYGATLTELHVPGRGGTFTNVVLGFDNLDQYLQGHPAFGATIGRFANRIANARFLLDGREIRVTPNAGQHHIHGGRTGFNRVLWESKALAPTEREAAVALSYRSVDGEEGYPGTLEVQVVYTLTDQNELVIQYSASTDKVTVVNLTNHSYFNLAGGGDVLKQELQIDARRYTPADEALIPTGAIVPVKGTALDFTSPMPIGARIAQFYPRPGGYDHNYVLDGDPAALKPAARAQDPGSGRVLECATTEPGVQLYTANWKEARLSGTGGIRYGPHAGFCLETQHFPDSVHHPQFPSTVLRPGQTFRSTTRFKFSVRG